MFSLRRGEFSSSFRGAKISPWRKQNENSKRTKETSVFLLLGSTTWLRINSSIIARSWSSWLWEKEENFRVENRFFVKTNFEPVRSDEKWIETLFRRSTDWWEWSKDREGFFSRKNQREIGNSSKTFLQRFVCRMTSFHWKEKVRSSWEKILFSLSRAFSRPINDRRTQRGNPKKSFSSTEKSTADSSNN